MGRLWKLGAWTIYFIQPRIFLNINHWSTTQNDLTKDLEFYKSNAELLCSRLQQYNLLDVDVRISHIHDIYKDLISFCVLECDLVYCNDNSGFA